MKIYRLCRKPAVTVPALASVKEALELMTKEKVGAVVVLENEEAAGMFTRRDAIERVVLKRLSLESTRISSVMTSPVEVLSQDTELGDALKMMAARPFNHIPVVDSESKVVGPRHNEASDETDYREALGRGGVTRSLHRRRRDWWLTGSSAIKFC